MNICVDCGKKITAKSKGRNAKRCRICYFKWRKKHPEILPNYKGGRHVYANAYIQIKVPDHPYARPSQGTVGEHRLVMEKKLGRFLLPTEVVHHINGKKHDNRIENLVVISSNAEHLRRHRQERGTQCKFAGCSRGGYLTHGYCKKHYARWLRAGLDTAPPTADPIKQCRICGQLLHIRSKSGFCQKHYLEHYNRNVRVR